MFSREKVEFLRKVYIEGSRIRLDYMEDKRAVPEGTLGTVVGVDGVGNILMKWDNGSTLSLIPEVDRFHIVK